LPLALLLACLHPVAAPSDPPTPDDSATFALALLSLDGVGRVTAQRLTEHFDGPGDLRSYPREQVFLRIKGVANAEAITERLFEGDALPEARARAEKRIGVLAEQGVRLLCPSSDDWPRGLDALGRPHRPLLLWAHGSTDALHPPSVAFLARPPMDEGPFERAQALAGHLLARGGVPVVGAQNGFDVALAKRAAGQNAPAVLVAACGLAQVPRKLRPAAGRAVRAGGLLLSPFPMQHGPFDHDDREGALVQAALARTAVFALPESDDAPEARALEWAMGADRPAFVLGEHAPSGARPVRGPDDFDAVLETATRENGES